MVGMLDSFVFVKMKTSVILLALAALVAVASAKKSYDGYEVWRVTLNGSNGRQQGNKIGDIIKHFNLDVWSQSKSSLDLMIKPDLLRHVSTSLARQRLQWKKIIPDVGALIKAEDERLSVKPLDFTLDDYNTFEDIEGYLQDVASSSPYASLNSLGQSLEGRDLWQLKISVGDGKPSVWIDCDIHAREWITAATCLYGINYLTESYGTDADVTGLLDAYDVYIMPVNNPDGYAYTWSDDRMWRKNRRKYDEDLCYGVDLNRNFDDNFGGLGTSSNSCSETYRGPSAASEPETVATQDGIKDLIANADLQILYSIHSYSELWMYAFGYTYDLPPEAPELDAVSKIGVDALYAVNGVLYEYGPIANTIYPAASTTVDYAYAQGIVNSFTLELRDTGEYGFILPADQITPVGEETWAGLIASIMAIEV